MGEKFDTVKSFLFENVLSVSSEYGKEFLKQEAIPLITNELVKQGGNLLIDYGANMIPGIGGAISEYRTNRKINNIEKMVEIIDENNTTLKEKFERQTQENKEILDSIFEMVISKIENTSQEEKIRYILNGYTEFLDLSNPSFDVAYLYFDTLDKLTLLDIDVLKLSYYANHYPMLDSVEYNGPTYYEDVLSKYDINQSQYESIRENLLRLGLFENEYDDKLGTDLKSIQVAVDEIRNTTESIVAVLSGKGKTKIKTLSNKSKLKYKAKDRLKISKFGRNFVKYFLIDSESV